MINKKAYEKLLDSFDVNVILGVELHIRNYSDADPYHCHIFFDIPKLKILENIDAINNILSELYPKKMVDKTDDIPKLEDISRRFNSYEYIMLPHGGQSHKTFDKSFPRGKFINFDTAIERNIYYNQFDGFTSRSNNGVEETEKYFKKLGINTFVNLITCTDNYEPSKYPSSKSSMDEDFIPTWINSKPTFQGLRLALSEKSRLFYQKEEPIFYDDYIKHVELKNNYIDIDVDLTPGLNVIIGGSSSGKTLFMDSLYRKINTNSPDNEAYKKYDVKELIVSNPSGRIPHYINQNYIIKVIDENSDLGIENIDIIKNTFLSNDNLDSQAKDELAKLKSTIESLFKSVSEIESLQANIKKIEHFPRLILKNETRKNYYEKLIPSNDVLESIKITENELSNYDDFFAKLENLSKENPFINNKIVSDSISLIKKELEVAKEKERCSDSILEIIIKYKENFDSDETNIKEKDSKHKKEFERLVGLISDYKKQKDSFFNQLDSLRKFAFEYKTNPIKSNGHELNVESKFSLNDKIILEAINDVLLNEFKINSFDKLIPENLFQDRIKKTIKKDIATKIYSSIEKQNKRRYVIKTKDNKNFDELSPGWKTAILLDLILGYKEDYAPIFIDQPEDNLATNYINSDLIAGIKKCKKDKQVLIISHNATIPMLADAQNIILCRNDNGKIVIKSGAMEDVIDGKPVVDYIAEITDGGKASIKKRVKKYNLKSFGYISKLVRCINSINEYIF